MKMGVSEEPEFMSLEISVVTQTYTVYYTTINKIKFWWISLNVTDDAIVKFYVT